MLVPHCWVILLKGVRLSYWGNEAGVVPQREQGQLLQLRGHQHSQRVEERLKICRFRRERHKQFSARFVIDILHIEEPTGEQIKETIMFLWEIKGGVTVKSRHSFVNLIYMSHFFVYGLTCWGFSWRDQHERRSSSETRRVLWGLFCCGSPPRRSHGDLCEHMRRAIRHKSTLQGWIPSRVNSPAVNIEALNL